MKNKIKRTGRVILYLSIPFIFGLVIIAHFSSASGEEGIQYSQVTLDTQESLETVNQLLSEADSNFQKALTERNNAQRKVCVQQEATAILKYADTPSHMTGELKRLHESAEYARSCPGIIDFQMNQT